MSGPGAPSRHPAAPPPGPTLREAVAGAARELAAAGVESARLEAERLVALAAGLERATLALRGAERLGPHEARTLARAIARRSRGEPLQHIEGEAAFRGLVLVADGRALVPRPETEELVEAVIHWARGRRPAGESSASGPAAAAGRARPVPRPGGDPPLACVLDIGTGSGAIALSLVAEGITERVVGVDRAPEALAQAAENRARLGLDGAVELRPCGSDPYGALDRAERFDAIVSNPPYVTTSELAGLSREVRDHDPAAALDGGADGLDVIRCIAAGAPGRLRPGGALFLEIGDRQGPAVHALLENAGAFARVEIRRDLAGRTRFALAFT
ncbi:MAG: peptide chain release factor N(5)-glutamine methyltransferase [Gemmatimonadota bacterium]|nr:peptide chain release factor N(5)-glutamine methyltransferase [Gemmatimonadota bacterium]